MSYIINYIEVIIAAIIWGSSGSFVKYLSLPTVTLAFFRFAIPSLFVGLYLLYQKKKFKFKDSRMMLLASLFNAVRLILYYIAFLMTSIGNAVIILYTWPIFSTIFSRLFLKEKIIRKQWVLLLISFIGIMIIYMNKNFTFGDKDFVGMSAMLLSAIIYSSTVVIFKHNSPSYSPTETLFYQNIIGSFIFLPFLFFNPFPEFTKLSVTVVYVVLVGVIGYWIFFFALNKINASTASSLAYIEVLSAIILGMILFGETLTIEMVIGGTMIIFSSLMLVMSKNNKKNKEITEID